MKNILKNADNAERLLRQTSGTMILRLARTYRHLCNEEEQRRGNALRYPQSGKGCSLTTLSLHLYFMQKHHLAEYMLSHPPFQC